MALVACLDLFLVLSLVWTAARRGFEATLPLAACFLIMFPEEAKLPIFGVFDLTAQRLVTLVLLICSAFFRDNTGDQPRRLPLKAGVVFVALWWIVSTLNSIDLSNSLKSVLSLVLDYLMIYMVFATRITSKASMEKILTGVADGLIILCVFGLIEAYANWSVVSLFPATAHRFGTSGGLYVDEARGLRIQSTFGHPILFGSALAMGIPIALHLLTGVKGRLRRAWLWAGLLLMFLCIFKTSSRGPWIALAGSLCLCLLLGRGQLRKYVISILLLAVMAVVIRPGVWETLQNDYAATVDEHSSQGESYIYRYALYRLVMEKVDDSPGRSLWGYGPQSFPSLHLSGFIHQRWMRFVSCDSSFAALLAETGYIGLISMSLILLYPCFFAVRTFRRMDPSNRQLCLILFVNIATFLFQMTNVAILGWGQQTILLWVVIAMTMVYPAVSASEADTQMLTETAQVWNDTCYEEWAAQALEPSTN
jgi:O-Antigen ligase